MSDLPDIDTNTVSFLAYWNAIDQGGVSEIDPADVVSHPRVVEYTAYDNGVEGTFDLVTGSRSNDLDQPRQATFRVKNDGWMVVYLDRSATYARDVRTGNLPRGPWDIVNDWLYVDDGSNSAPPVATIVKNALERAINALLGEFPNSSNMTYSPGDVGLYDYEFTDATNTTLFAWAADGAKNVSLRFQYTAGTTIYRADVMGSLDCYYQDAGDLSFEGYTLAAQNGNSRFFGTLDAVGNNLLANSGTEYGHDIGDTGNAEHIRAEAVATWS